VVIVPPKGVLGIVEARAFEPLWNLIHRLVLHDFGELHRMQDVRVFPHSLPERRGVLHGPLVQVMVIGCKQRLTDYEKGHIKYPARKKKKIERVRGGCSTFISTYS
jgi:hypothetical protein